MTQTLVNQAVSGLSLLLVAIVGLFLTALAVVIIMKLFQLILRVVNGQPGAKGEAAAMGMTLPSPPAYRSEDWRPAARSHFGTEAIAEFERGVAVEDAARGRTLPPPPTPPKPGGPLPDYGDNPPPRPPRAPSEDQRVYEERSNGLRWYADERGW